MRAAERDLRKLLAKAFEAGYTLEQTARGGHLKLRRPDGTLAVVMHKTPSDHRAVQNTCRDLRRAGVPL